jgi:DNA-binding CsgD family transcriptional regulator
MLKDVLMQKGLSHREAEVVELVAQGLSNKEVADKLFVTEKTIKFHLTNIYKKMNVKSRAQLIVWCLPHVGFVDNRKKIIPTNTTESYTAKHESENEKLLAQDVAASMNLPGKTNFS